MQCFCVSRNTRFSRSAQKHRKLRCKSACRACFTWFYLLRNCSGGPRTHAEGASGRPQEPLWASFLRRAFAKLFFGARGQQKKRDFDTPRTSKIVLSPRRRASFRKITHFRMEALLARLGNPLGPNFGPHFGPWGPPRGPPGAILKICVGARRVKKELKRGLKRSALLGPAADPKRDQKGTSF